MFFFFKQKTAYEMRISDWSSDVCSSDLCAEMTKRRSPVCSAVPARSSRTGWSPEMPSAQRSPRRNPCDADREKLVRAERRKDKSRSEERRVGKECVSTGRSRWSTYH